MKKSILPIALLLLTIPLFSQKKTYYGLEAAATDNRYIYSQPDPSFRISKPLLSGMLGVHARHDLNNYFSLETGLVFHNYYADNYIQFNDSFNTAFYPSYRSWLIPLRLRLKINLYRNKIFFTPLIGLHLCMNQFNKANVNISIHKKNREDKDSVFVTEISQSIHRNIPLIETGFGLEFNIGKLGMLTFSAGYYSSFFKTYELGISYHHNNDAPVTAAAYTKGHCISIAIGYNYCISELFKNSRQETE